MNIEDRLKIIEELFRLYDNFSHGYNNACRKGCALCCTVNVTMTSLEGLRILAYWQAQGRNMPETELTAAACNVRFEPSITINQLAALCMKDEQVAEDEADPNVGPCPLLKDNCCSIYPVRPFGCRAMVSRTDCSKIGAADMPEPVLGVNNLFLQFIEAIDMPGVSGNLIDILLVLTDAAFKTNYESGQCIAPPGQLLSNQAIPAIMIDPAHRTFMEPLLAGIRKIIQGSNNQR